MKEAVAVTATAGQIMDSAAMMEITTVIMVTSEGMIIIPEAMAASPGLKTGAVLMIHLSEGIMAV
jgi:hypothetical protein